MVVSKTLIAAFVLLSAAPVLAQPIDADPRWQAPPPGPVPAPTDAGQDWNGRAYVGLRGSYAFNANSVTTYAPTSPPTTLRASYASGGGGSVYLGARLPLNFRLELEALARWQPVSTLSLNGIGTPASGNTRIAAPMLNLIWDFPLGDDFPIQPFVGMGVGAAYTETDVNGSGNTYMHQNRWDLAYSFLSGLAMPLNDNSRLTALYRWMQMRDAGHKCATSGTVQSVCLDNNVNSSSVDLGLEMDL